MSDCSVTGEIKREQLGRTLQRVVLFLVNKKSGLLTTPEIKTLNKKKLSHVDVIILLLGNTVRLIHSKGDY